jgi:hypothetical protein
MLENSCLPQVFLEPQGLFINHFSKLILSDETMVIPIKDTQFSYHAEADKSSRQPLSVGNWNGNMHIDARGDT